MIKFIIFSITINYIARKKEKLIENNLDWKVTVKSDFSTVRFGSVSSKFNPQKISKCIIR